MYGPTGYWRRNLWPPICRLRSHCQTMASVFVGLFRNTRATSQPASRCWCTSRAYLGPSPGPALRDRPLPRERLVSLLRVDALLHHALEHLQRQIDSAHWRGDLHAGDLTANTLERLA